MSFDGISATNGFQPLFLALLIPFGKLFFNEPETSLRLILIIVSIITLLAGLQLKKLALQLTNSHLFGNIALALFLIHPKILSVTFNGTEAALSFFFIITSLRAFIWINEDKKLVLSSFIFTGLVLTRFDFSVFLGLLMLFSLTRKLHLKTIVFVTILPALSFITWLGINYYFFNNILPGSGIAKQLHSNAINGFIINKLLSGFRTVVMSESVLSIVTLFLLLTSFYALIKIGNSKTKHIILIIFILGSVLLLLPIITIGNYRDWYLTPLYVWVILICSYSTYYINKQIKTAKYFLLLIPVLLWVEAQYSKRNMNGYETLLACKETQLLIPKNSSVGAFNCGIISACLGKTNTVINIDGVVNNNILPYYKNKNIDGYIRENNIEYILDQKESIDFFLNNFSHNLNLVLINSFQYKSINFALYKVNSPQ